MATNTKTTTSTTTTKTDAASSNIEQLVQEKTPSFISKNFTLVKNNLEDFRINYFNSQYIFYPILVIVIFLLIRYLWRRFF